MPVFASRFQEISEWCISGKHWCKGIFVLLYRSTSSFAVQMESMNKFNMCFLILQIYLESSTTNLSFLSFPPQNNATLCNNLQPCIANIIIIIEACSEYRPYHLTRCIFYYVQINYGNEFLGMSLLCNLNYFRLC